MIVNEVNKFMALAPLILPSLIDRKKCDEPDIADESAILYFEFDEVFPLGCVMDMLDEDMDMLMLYHATSQTNPNIQHCCFFANPKTGQSMYKINVQTDEHGFADGITVTIYDSLDIWEQELESDLTVHQSAFDFTEAMTVQEVLATFCTMI